LAIGPFAASRMVLVALLPLLGLALVWRDRPLDLRHWLASRLRGRLVTPREVRG